MLKRCGGGKLSKLYQGLHDQLESESKPYPIWICHECGDKYGNRPFGVATWHQDVCGVCGETKACTEPRDCGHLKPEWVNA